MLRYLCCTYLGDGGRRHRCRLCLSLSSSLAWSPAKFIKLFFKFTITSTLEISINLIVEKHFTRHYIERENFSTTESKPQWRKLTIMKSICHFCVLFQVWIFSVSNLSNEFFRCVLYTYNLNKEGNFLQPISISFPIFSYFCFSVVSNFFFVRHSCLLLCVCVCV